MRNAVTSQRSSRPILPWVPACAGMTGGSSDLSRARVVADHPPPGACAPTSPSRGEVVVVATSVQIPSPLEGEG